MELETGGKSLDLRVSVLPTAYGEKVVIRVLDRSSFLLSQKQLGLIEENEVLFNRLMKVPHGIILVTGPTGSGKTTTLYAALRELNDVSVNIITLEDPIEYRLEGVNQMQVNPKAWLTFAGGLRSVLRQDPNIIMVGEIRDEETAACGQSCHKRALGAFHAATMMPQVRFLDSWTWGWNHTLWLRL